MSTDKTSIPLTPAVLHILIALSTGERYGYEIMKQVENDSENKVTMGPGTLYGSLKRMLEAGLLEESGKRIDPATNKERIYYKITGLGKRTLAEELTRYRHLVSLTEKRKILPETLLYGF